MANINRIGTHKTKVSHNNGELSVVYHETEVVNVSNGKIRLNTGGYPSMTTKTRMNQASNEHGLNYRVYQRNFDWFVDYRGETHEFNGNILELNA